MTTPLLIPLQCMNCQTPLLAEPDEVAWLCQACGHGSLLDQIQPSGLSPVEFHFAADIPNGQQGHPYWVAQGIVKLQRDTYSGNENRQADEFWKIPRTFFVPAFACSLEQLVNSGMQFLKQPLSIMQGKPAAFLPVTLSPEDIHPMAEFIIMGFEAERRDMVKSVSVQLSLAAPSLWVLP